jgi:hypothetical protein
MYTTIEVLPEWRLDQEPMGSKRKFWYRRADGESQWLFKYARLIRPGLLSGEHWAEKITEQVADRMKVLHAKVELAVFEGEQGVACESFISKDRGLVHGNEILKDMDAGYDPTKNFKQTQHTLGRIFSSFEEIFEEQRMASECRRRFAEYLVLDALIANVDRHHENWGILLKRVLLRQVGYLAPSFDHASSLGRELTDEKRHRILGEGGIGNYAEKGHGAIFWEEAGRKAPSPLELVRRAAVFHREIFQAALGKLSGITADDFAVMVGNVPEGWMSPPSRLFAKELLCYNFEQLRKLRDSAS